MQRIKSFEINHNVLVPGFYISREDGDVVTYDLRTRKPNAGDYMSNAVMHSVEHMFATFARNSEVSYKDFISLSVIWSQRKFLNLQKKFLSRQ